MDHTACIRVCNESDTAWYRLLDTVYYSITFQTNIVVVIQLFDIQTSIDDICLRMLSSRQYRQCLHPIDSLSNRESLSIKSTVLLYVYHICPMTCTVSTSPK